VHVVACDVAIIGGGPAGLAAAIAAADEGAKVVIIERDKYLGGILPQCIHLGFGLKYFGEELSGPEYAERFIREVSDRDISVMLGTMALSIDSEHYYIQTVNPQSGNQTVSAKSIVLAMGCRERTRGAISVPGTRPAGILSAGTAQRFINIQNQRVGKKIVILGSGDIGMIMARRLTLEGSEVAAVIEIMPYLTGLTRNKVQCLDDFSIPLFLKHTIVDIKGAERVTSVTVAQVDSAGKVLPDTSWEIPCDTVLFSVGLIPENELSKQCGVKLDPLTLGAVVDQWMQTNRPGIFACGNVLHVNDLVDNVSVEGYLAGQNAARFALRVLPTVQHYVSVCPGEGIRYVVPGHIYPDTGVKELPLCFRVTRPMCNVIIKAEINGRVLAEKKCLRVNPGEMEDLIIPMDSLSQSEAHKITVFMEEVS